MKAFSNLEVEKRQKIINAAFDEFTEKGYELASTNQIVKNAGIGKGMLFYYFTNKHELFLFLIEYAIEITEKEFLNKLSEAPDLFERFKNVAIQKLAFLTQYPNAMNFMAKVMINEADQLDETVKEKIHVLEQKTYKLLYSRIDTNLFREEIETEKAIKIIQWTFRGYEEEMTYRLKNENIDVRNLENYFEEFHDYIGVMKKAFYKGGH